MAGEFRFKQFKIRHSDDVMKVGTDGVLLGAYVNPSNSQNILDIGTGTGLIALMLAQKTNANITAVDINSQAKEIALENFKLSPWIDQLDVKITNLKDYKPEQKFDLIVSNPPFFSTDVKAPNKNRAVARHTIELLPIDIIEFCKENLSIDGKCYVIYPVYVADEFMKLANELGMYSKVVLNVKSNYKSDIIRQIVCLKLYDFETKEEIICIEKEKRHDYTPEYKILTGDYYLNF